MANEVITNETNELVGTTDEVVKDRNGFDLKSAGVGAGIAGLVALAVITTKKVVKHIKNKRAEKRDAKQEESDQEIENCDEKRRTLMEKFHDKFSREEETEG